MTGRRKSNRKGSSSKKDSPEKTRRSSRRKNYKKSESEDDSGSDNSNDDSATNENAPVNEKKDNVVNEGNKEEESGSSDGAWQVKSENGNKGGIPKLKLCLQRPPEMASPTSESLHSPRPRKSRKTEEQGEENIASDSTEDKVKDSSETSENETDRRSTRSRRHNEKKDKSQSLETGDDSSNVLQTIEEINDEIATTEEIVNDNVCTEDSKEEIENTEVESEVPEQICIKEVIEVRDQEVEVENQELRDEPVPVEESAIREVPDEIKVEDSVKSEEANIEEEVKVDAEIEVVNVVNNSHENEVSKDWERKRRSPSRNSSEERAKEAALRSRRPKRKEGSEDGEVVESPERDISFPSRTGSKIRTTNISADDTADKDASQETTVAHVRKRRWGSSSSKKQAVSISTDVLKEIIPEARPLPLSDVQLSPDEEEETLPQNTNRRGSKSDDEKQQEQQRTLQKSRKNIPSDESEKDYEEEGVDSGGEEMIKKHKPADKIIKIDPDEKQAQRKEGPKLVVRSQAPDPLAALTKQRSPSPASNPTSSILYITNLVRPFTVVQLRDLLARTGSIVQGDGFWIDSIKSRCYVQYSSEEEATNTRNALHGVRWPASNPKQLNVDFGTEVAMKAVMEGVKLPPAPSQKEPERRVFDELISKERDRIKEREVKEKSDRDKRGREETRHRDRIETKIDNSERKIRVVERSKDDRERSRDEKSSRTVRKVTIPVREWDLGKAERGFSPPNDSKRYGDDVNDERRKRDKERFRRSTSQEPVRKVKKIEDDAPPPKLLLDDLFCKTQSAPSVYWLPLTAQQIAVREEMRRRHMEDHEKQVAEQKKKQEVKRKHPRSRSRSLKK